MGKVSPKFPTMETGRSFTFSSNSCVTVLCPAQAFPAPLFRYFIYDTLVSLEPVGRVSPKFPSMDSSRSFSALLNASLTILCPAQAFPVPLFR